MSGEVVGETKQPAIEITDEYEEAITLFRAKRNLLITGPAGTGKSTLVGELIRIATKDRDTEALEQRLMNQTKEELACPIAFARVMSEMSRSSGEEFMMLCAPTGTASLQLPNGRTLHGAMKIPVGTYPNHKDLEKYYLKLWSSNATDGKRSKNKLKPKPKPKSFFSASGGGSSSGGSGGGGGGADPSQTINLSALFCDLEK